MRPDAMPAAVEPDEDLSLPPGHRPAQWFLGSLLLGLSLWSVIGCTAWIAWRWWFG